MLNVSKFSALALAILLAGCGGGGSDGYYDQSGSNNNSGGNANNPGTGEEVQTINISAIELQDSNGEGGQSITPLGVIAKVKVTDQSGQGISGAIVNFSSTAPVVFGTTNGAVLSNAEGIASITVMPQDDTTTGVYRITAQAEYDGNTASNELAFSLQALTVNLSPITVANASLASGGSTNVSLTTSNQYGTAQNNIPVNFNATCGTFEPASVTSVNQGNVLTSYKAISATGDLCEGPVTINALTANGQTSVSANLNVQAILADSLVYSSTAPVSLGVKGSGAAASGQIEFTLYANGIPAANKDVLLTINEAPNDLSFGDLNNRLPKTITSNADGKVFVNLYPGSIPGPVEIRAALKDDPTVFALSKDVSISVGRVTQSGMSLSVSKQALRTDIDGDSSTITARLVDRTGNPVPAGTVISFVSEGGKVDPNCMTDAAGVCTVTLTTQNPRPLDNRVSVLAYVEGDKSYIDVNGDNIYTPNVDTLTQNIGDFFRDDNENNLHDLGEFIYRKAAGSLACSASTVLQPNMQETCNNGLNAVLRQQMIFGFSHDTPTFVWGAGVSDASVAGDGSFSFRVFGNSQQRVSMPSGTTVSAESADKTNNGKDCSVELRSGYATVPGAINFTDLSTSGDNLDSVSRYTVLVRDCAVGDDVKIVTSVPSGKMTTSWLQVR